MLLIFTTYKISFIYQTFRLVGMKAFYFPTDIFISSEKKHMKTVEIINLIVYSMNWVSSINVLKQVAWLQGGMCSHGRSLCPTPHPPFDNLQCVAGMSAWPVSPPPKKKSLHHWLSCSFTPSYTAAQNITFSNLILDFWVFYDFNCINYDWRIYWGSFWAPGLGGSTWRVWTSWPSCQRICVGLRSHNYHPRYSHVLASE